MRDYATKMNRKKSTERRDKSITKKVANEMSKHKKEKWHEKV